MEDLDDDARAIEDARIGRAFEVARLARRNLVIHDDHGGSLRIAVHFGAARIRLFLFFFLEVVFALFRRGAQLIQTFIVDLHRRRFLQD